VSALNADTSNEKVLELIKSIKSDHHYWGYRRVKSRLSRLLVNRKRVYRLMKNNGLLVDAKHYKAKRTITRDKPRWGTDMTKFYVKTVGWVYLVFVLDWYTKK
jgi:putative transposase